MIKKLKTLEKFEELYQQQTSWILFKHSPTCSISERAYHNLSSFAKDKNLQIYMLDVLDTGELKYEIENILGILHKSPQVIVFDNGGAIANTSHRDIGPERLTKNIQKHNN